MVMRWWDGGITVAVALLLFVLRTHALDSHLAPIRIATLPDGYIYGGHLNITEALINTGRFRGSSSHAAAKSNGNAMPRPMLGGEEDAASGNEKEYVTVMFTRDGHIFTKPLHPSVTEKRDRRLTEVANPMQVSTSTINPNLECSGCPNTDVRQRVSTSQSQALPFSAVGYLTRAEQGQSTIAACTGTLIGPRQVLTAAHCVVDTTSWNSLTSISFTPDLNGNSQPYDPISAASVRVLSQFTAPRDYTPESMNYDFALITLEQDAPAAVGKLNIEAGYGQQQWDLDTAGYPGDKPQTTMWTAACPNVDINFDGSDLPCGDSCPNMMSHTCISYNGQSGSAIWSTNSSGAATIRAVLTGSVTMSDDTVYNTGVELNPFVYNTIVSWYNEDRNISGSTGSIPLTPAVDNSSSGSSFSNSKVGGFPLPILLGIVGGVLALLLVLCIFCACCRRAKISKPQRPISTANVAGARPLRNNGQSNRVNGSAGRVPNGAYVTGTPATASAPMISTGSPSPYYYNTGRTANGSYPNGTYAGYNGGYNGYNGGYSNGAVYGAAPYNANGYPNPSAPPPPGYPQVGGGNRNVAPQPRAHGSGPTPSQSKGTARWTRK